MRLKYTLALIVILCLANCLTCNIYASDSSAVSNDSPNGDVSKQIIGEEHQSINNLREQIALLENKNRLLEEKNQNLLNQMYRALNLAPMFTIAVIGLIIYSTHRRYEKDKLLLMCIIKSETAKLRAEFENRYSEAFRPVDERLKSLTENNLIFQMEVSTLQAEQQMSKGQLTNAIRCWVDVAQKAWSIKWNWRVAFALDKIKYLLENGAKITLQSSKTELTAFLQSLPPQFESLVKAIQIKI